MRAAYRLSQLLFFVIVLACLTGSPACAQTSLTLVVRDSASGRALEDASVGIAGTSTGVSTDAQGRAVLIPYPPIGARVSISMIGYRQVLLEVTPTTGPELTVPLAAEGHQLEEVVVTTTRTNSRLEDLPTRVEVLGAEEMEEENAIKPGNIASLLGDLAGVQIQPTSPTTGNADMRIQGLQGRYSQILRDGMPVLGGYAGGFSILQIPPLDLKQAELIKGSSSTLYGGGSIAGLVNLVSKTPTLGKEEWGATINQTTLKESNLNVYTSRRWQKVGYTLFAGGTRQQYVDVNGDGFTDVPKLDNLVIHPRLFFYPKIAGKDGQLVLGYTATLDRRLSGDIAAIKGEHDTAHAYRVSNRMNRHTADLIYTQPLGPGTLSVKGVVSFFDRNVETNTVAFAANQVSHYSEISYLLPLGRHSLVFGANYNGESLNRDANSLTPLLAPYTFNTVGGFAQGTVMATPTTTIEGGLRLDRHNRYGTFLLPRLAVLQKIGSDFTIRLNSGYGYRAVVPYVNELDERQMPRVRPLSGSAERSIGANGDITYKHSFGEAMLTLSQGYFFTQLQNPAIVESVPVVGFDPADLAWVNQTQPMRTQGLESYARLSAGETELYLGYVYTDARRLYDPIRPYVELAAQHKLSTVFIQELADGFEAGIEASYIGKQHVDMEYYEPGYDRNNPQRVVPAYVILAAMLRYRLGNFTFVANGENLLDYRQTRQEAVLYGPRTSPSFRQLWAPIEGRVLNFSITYRLTRSVN